MCVLKLTLGKIIFLQIFFQFLFFSVKRPTVSSCVRTSVAQTARRLGDTSGRAQPCRMLMWHLAFGWVSDASKRAPYRVKYCFLL